MEQLTVNLSGGVRREKWRGKEYLVAPMTLIVPGVLNGSRGALYYPPEEIRRSVPDWNGVNITVHHPRSSGGGSASASDPDVLKAQGVGVVRNPRWDNGLKAEGWFDPDRTRVVNEGVLRLLEAGRPFELSTGLFTENEPAENGASYGGKPYTAIARNYRPDHLAVLPDQVGACSVRDGCGVIVNEETEHVERWDSLEDEMEGTENFNPSQPRDAQGRFGSGGGGGGGGGGSSESIKNLADITKDAEIASSLSEKTFQGPAKQAAHALSQSKVLADRLKNGDKAAASRLATSLSESHDQLSSIHARYADRFQGDSREFPHANASQAHKSLASKYQGLSKSILTENVEDETEGTATVTDNQLSSDDLRRRLSDLLRERMGGLPTGQELSADDGPTYPYIDEVFVVGRGSPYLIYTRDDKTYRLGFSVDGRNDEVSLSGEAPVEVQRVTRYEPVSNEEGDETTDNTASEKLLDQLTERFGEGVKVLRTAGNSVTYQVRGKTYRLSYAGSGDGARISAAKPTEVTENFNPSQPRDSQGRFGSGGGGGGGGGNMTAEEIDRVSVSKGKVVGLEGYRVSYQDVGHGTAAGTRGVVRNPEGNRVAQTKVFPGKTKISEVDGDLGFALREHLREKYGLPTTNATKTMAGKALPSSAFAYVPDPEKPSTWKLRIDDKAHVAGAVAAIGKGFRGQKASIPADDLPGVKKRILTAWKQFNPDKGDEDVPDVLTSNYSPNQPRDSQGRFGSGGGGGGGGAMAPDTGGMLQGGTGKGGGGGLSEDDMTEDLRMYGEGERMLRKAGLELSPEGAMSSWESEVVGGIESTASKLEKAGWERTELSGTDPKQIVGMRKKNDVLSLEAATGDSGETLTAITRRKVKSPQLQASKTRTEKARAKTRAKMEATEADIKKKLGPKKAKQRDDAYKEAAKLEKQLGGWEGTNFEKTAKYKAAEQRYADVSQTISKLESGLRGTRKRKQFTKTRTKNTEQHTSNGRRGGQTTNHRRLRMTERDREKMVAYIVENCGYCDEETVENWDDSQVQGQYELLQKAERIDNLEAELAELKKGKEKPTENLEVHPKPKNLTMDEWMNEQPEEVRNAFRFAKQQQDAHKIQLIEQIVENTRRQDDKAFLELLKTKDIPELEVLNSATHRPVNNDVPTFNFFGQAAPTAPRKATKLTPLPTADELMVEMGIAG